MIRSKKKGLFINYFLLKELFLNQKEKKVIKTLSRSSIIIPEMIGKTVGIYNGRHYFPLYIDNYVIGYKLGEFSPTRLYRGHKKIDKKIQRKKKN